MFETTAGVEGLVATFMAFYFGKADVSEATCSVEFAPFGDLVF